MLGKSKGRQVMFTMFGVISYAQEYKTNISLIYLNSSMEIAMAMLVLLVHPSSTSLLVSDKLVVM